MRKSGYSGFLVVLLYGAALSSFADSVMNWPSSRDIVACARVPLLMSQISFSIMFFFHNC